MTYSTNDKVEILTDGGWSFGTIHGVVMGEDAVLRAYWVRCDNSDGEYSLHRVPADRVARRLRLRIVALGACQRCGADGDDLLLDPCLGGSSHVLARVPA
jgi:hypothetical protein